MEFSLGFWVWSFLAAPAPIPELLIANDPAVLVEHMLDSWSDVPNVFPPEVRAEYIAQFRDPEAVRAICEQYRAAATIDFDLDESDRGSVRIECPVLALWSATGAVEAWYDPLAVWREWATDVRGRAVDAGHFIPEEAPDEVAKELLAFLGSPQRA